MGAVYDAGSEPTLRVWDPRNPVTHPNCLCTYVPIGPPEITDGPTEIEAAGVYTYTWKCGPPPYTCSVDDDRVTISNIRTTAQSTWAHPSVPEYQLDLNLPEPCEDVFTVELTIADKDEDEATLSIDITCGCCNDAAYVPPEITGESEVIKPALYYYEVEGGCPPYTWSLDPEEPTGVELNPTGPTTALVRLYSEACGSVAVCVEDDCEESSELDLRITNQGHWINRGEVTGLQAPWPGAVFFHTMPFCPEGPQAWNWRMVLAGRYRTLYIGRYRYRLMEVKVALGGDQACADLVTQNPALITEIQTILAEKYRVAMESPSHQLPSDICQNYSCWYPDPGDFEYVGQDHTVHIFWALNYYYLDTWTC